jgi:4-alpha-glucanotransferase
MVERRPEAFSKETKDITFSLTYKTEFGQVLAIVGNHPKVGKWTDYNIGLMKWYTGDLWKVTIKDLVVDEPFEYKYVVIDFKTKEAIRWEQGRNRICDPSYLSQEVCSKFNQSLSIHDDWEHFTVTFSIYFPG